MALSKIVNFDAKDCTDIKDVILVKTNTGLAIVALFINYKEYSHYLYSLELPFPTHELLKKWSGDVDGERTKFVEFFEKCTVSPVKVLSEEGQGVESVRDEGETYCSSISLINPEENLLKLALRVLTIGEDGKKSKSELNAKVFRVNTQLRMENAVLGESMASSPIVLKEEGFSKSERIYLENVAHHRRLFSGFYGVRCKDV